MVFVFFHILIQIIYSELQYEPLPLAESFPINKVATLLSSCPQRPSGSFVKSIIANDITTYSNNVVYGCNVHLTKQVKLNDGALQVYNSLFESTIESSIYLSLTANLILNSNLKKPFEIFGCNFTNCHSNNGAAIFINSTEVFKSITISECQFSNLASNQGGAIYYIYTHNPSVSNLDIITNEHALLIQDSTFNNITSETSGSICILAPKGKSSRLIEIKNCAFNDCKNTGLSDTSNGGAIYFSSSEVLRRFNVLHSTFSFCHSNSFGGAIYFNSILGNIRDCTFSNNNALKGGSDIFYEAGSTVSTTEKLAIFKNNFHHDYQSNSDSKSLIYLVLSDVSIFDFDSNQIYIKNDNYHVFGYNVKNQAYKGTLTIENNCLSPPDSSLYEVGDILSTKINFYSAFSKQCSEQECPSKPENSFDIGPSGCDESNKILFACNHEFERNEIKVTNSVLDVFNCSFKRTLQNHFPISIIINSNIQNEMIGPTKIRNCNFEECGSEAIHIESSVSKMGFDIIGCFFSRNKNGAIYIKSSLGLIQKCYFLDNSMNDQHLDIQYECGLVESSVENGQSLTISDNTFNLTYKNGNGQNHGCFIYVHFNSKSIFDFNNNQIIIDGSLDSAENLFVFDCSSSSSFKGSWSIFDNCLSPPNDHFIKSENIPDGFIDDLDLAFKDICLTAECPSMIDGSTVLWDGNYKETDVFENLNVYACGQYLDTHVQLERCLLRIYHCIFSSCRPDSAHKGGAVYIQTDNSMTQESNEAVEIFNCQFNGCEEDSGGALYIESSDSSRLFDIRGCTFDHNKAISSGSAPGSGGSIYVNAALINIENCIFSWNTAKNGASVYVMSHAPHVESQSIVIIGCSFEKNEAEIDGGDIYYEYSSSRSSSSKLLDENKFSLSITDSVFNKCSSAQNGASLALKLCSEVSYKIVINNCTFNECLSLKYGGAIYLESDNYATLFDISNCIFESTNGNYGSSIYFVCCNCNIKNCQFIKIFGSGDSSCVLYYNNNNYGYTTQGEITIDGCRFEQSEEINSIIGYVSRSSTVFNYNNNDVFINNNKTVIFASWYGTQGDWHFNGNTVDPPYDKFIKGSSSTLKAACGNGFICLLPTEIPTNSSDPFVICKEGQRCIHNGDETDPKFVLISSSSFNGLQCNDNGAAVSLKNCGLKCDDTKFTSCMANSGGGGAVYVYINKEISAPVEFNGVKFTSCQAAFGGASYIYSDIKTINVIFNNCHFVKNKAITGINKEFSGGNSLYLTVQQGSINNCNFSKNFGLSSVKVTNKFKKILQESSDIISSISFTDCSFETDGNSTSSFHLAKETNNDFHVNMKNCIFGGRLSKNTYHIETENLAEKTYSPKFVVDSCKFSSDKKESIKNDPFIIILNIDKQEFNNNYRENLGFMKKKSFLVVLLINAIVVAVFIFNMRRKLLVDLKNNRKDDDSMMINSII